MKNRKSLFVTILSVALLLTVDLTVAQNPNFSENIATIIYKECTGCHRPGGVAPFALISFDDVFTNRFSIQNEVMAGHMPPWPPDDTYVSFSNDRALSQAEKNAINDWVNNGAPRGDSTLAPCPPDYSASSFLGTPDLKLTIPTYTSNASASADDYVCFALPTGLGVNKVIRSMEIIPGNRAIVHHVIVYIDPTGNYQTNTSGSCMGPGNAPVVGAYAPGSLPTVFPNGMGVTLQVGSKIILAMHYPEGSAGERDSTSVHFFFYPDSVTTTRTVSVAPVAYDLSFCVPANNSNYVLNKNSGAIPTALSVISIFPHMHLLGKSVESFAVTPTNDTIGLIRISEWDFEWQGFYNYKNIIKIPAGSVIYSKGVYDNSINNPHNPNSPPQMVCGGLNTSDEMFIVSLQVTTYQNGDENISLESLLAPPQPAISSTGTSLCNGSVSLMADPGYVSYRWCPGGQTAQSISVSSPGAYYVEVKDSRGIPGNSNAIVVTSGSVNPPTVASQNICAGASATLTASGGVSYSWNTGTTGASIMVSPASTTSYTVTAMDGSGCTASASATVTVNLNPTINTTGAGNICEGGSTTLTASGGNTYMWSNGATGASIIVNPVVNTSYTVTGTDLNGCTASSAAGVTILPKPLVGISPPVVVVCQGDNATLTANGGVSYSWNTSSTAAGITVTPTSTTMYSVTVTDANSCTASASKTVTVNPIPVASISPSASSICDGESAMLAASGGVTFIWSIASTTTNISVSPVSTTSYTVTVTDANGCTATTNSTIQVNPLPVVDAGEDVIICEGLSSALSATGGTNYLWSTGETTANINVNPAVTTDYTVSVTDANGCLNSDDVKITVEVCTNVQIAQSPVKLDVYPNPTDDEMVISFETTEQSSVFLFLKDVNGRTLFEDINSDFKGSYKKIMDVSKYAKGIYFLQVITGNGFAVKKILVN